MDISRIVVRGRMIADRCINRGLNSLGHVDLFYVVEPTDWVIKDVGKHITAHLPHVRCRLTTTHEGARHAIVHYGSKYLFFGPRDLLRPGASNKTVVTWYHISPDDMNLLKRIPQAVPHVDRWHTACTLTRDKLVKAGVPADQLSVVPLGVDTRKFSVPDAGERGAMRRHVGAADGAIVIGSFQKDGCGWGDGDQPKLIKGPDIFCDVVERLATRFPIHVLLTGPARGYVKARLRQARIPFFHKYLQSPSEVAAYYKALDLYLMCSREEGGPQSVLESLACGVPLVAADTGLSRDVIRNAENSFLVPVGDVAAFIAAAESIICHQDISRRFKREGPVTAKEYDWGTIAERMYAEVYAHVLEVKR